MFGIGKNKEVKILPAREARDLAANTESNFRRYIEDFNKKIAEAAEKGEWSVHTHHPSRGAHEPDHKTPPPLAQKLMNHLRQAGYYVTWRELSGYHDKPYSIHIRWD